jgi:ABC-type molybdate transport system substrate-binding protein
VTRKWSIAAVLAAAAAGSVLPIALSIRPVDAAEVTVISAVAVKSALDDLAANFERSTGDKLTISYATAGEVIKRIEAGEIADLTILPRPRMDELVQQSKIAVTMVPEILPVRGVDLVGPLPQDLQNKTDFAYVAGLLAAAKQPSAGKAFIQFISGPAAGPVVKSKGLDPG